MIVRLIYSITMMVFLVGCAGKSSTHEKAIADFVQTDKRGVWTDLQFKVIEMGEPTSITIGDSIEYLTKQFESEKMERLSGLHSSILRNKTSMEKENSGVMKKAYQGWIDKNQVIVDSVSKMLVALPEAYVKGKPEQVLAQEVTCKFAITPPTYNARQEITETFILSANGEKCYRRKTKSQK